MLTIGNLDKRVCWCSLCDSIFLAAFLSVDFQIKWKVFCFWVFS